MRSLIVGLSLLATHVSVAQGPALIPDGRTIRDSRGGGGRSFSIDSRISGAERRYPVAIVLDGEASLLRLLPWRRSCRGMDWCRRW